MGGNEGILNFKSLLREFKRFYRNHIPFSKLISKMDEYEFLDKCLEFLSHPNFELALKNTMALISDSKISEPDSTEDKKHFNILNPAVLNNSIDNQEDIYREWKISYALNLGLLLNPQKVIKIDPKRVSGGERVEFMLRNLENTLIVNDLLFNFSIKRLGR